MGFISRYQLLIASGHTHTRTHAHTRTHTQTSGYRIMQIVRGGILSRFSRISLQLQKFSSEFFLSIKRCFELLYNHESFSANNKIIQPQNFSTANDLHYTVEIILRNKHAPPAPSLKTAHLMVTNATANSYSIQFWHLWSCALETLVKWQLKD